MGLGDGGGTPAFLATGLTVASRQLVVQFNAGVVVVGPAADPASYLITGGGQPVTVLHATPTGSTLVLDTSFQTTGANYVLSLPTLGILSSDSRVLAGPFSFNFVGADQDPVSVQIVRSLDARHLEIVFDRPVVRSDAETIANYSVSPTLSVLQSTRITDFVYALRTTRQVQGQTYEVTISNIRGM